MSIRVRKPGAFTTVQDLGRPGCGAWGVPPAGAMDELSFRAANLLVGNDEEAAVLECTLIGPELYLEDDHLLAVAGAPFDVHLDGSPVEPGRSFVAPRGSTLTLERARSGVRCYLAVAGGIDVPLVLGSRSTLASAVFGGLEGRTLRAGDVIAVPATATTMRERRLRADVPASWERDRPARAIPGPQDDAFTARGREAFFSSPFRVSTRADRAGVRLEGDPVELAGDADLDPEGVVTGAVQVPADGMPIVLGPDRPATGGYVKIATVIAADMPLVAQARPGDTLRFVEVGPDEAREAMRVGLRRLRAGIEELR